MAVAVEQDGWSAGAKRQIKLPLFVKAREEFLDQERALGEPVGPRVVQQFRVLVAECQDAARLAADDRDSLSAYGVDGSRLSAAFLSPSRACPSRSSVGRSSFLRAGPPRIPRPRARPPPVRPRGSGRSCRCRGRGPPDHGPVHPVPRARRPNQRANVSRANGGKLTVRWMPTAVEDPAGRGGLGHPVRDGAQAPPRRSRSPGSHHPVTERRTVFWLVLREEFGLQPRHVHVRRAFRLAALALQAQVDHLVHSRGVRASAGRRPSMAARSALARPRVECSSSRVTM